MKNKCFDTDKLRIKSIQNDIVIFKDESRETVRDFIKHYNGLIDYLGELVNGDER